MSSRRATCSCGALEVTCEGDPVRVSVCHCLACQKRTGSVFGQQARFPLEKLAAKGDEKIWVRTTDEGNTVTHHFCPTCGSTVYYELGALPGFAGVPVGGFADPTFPSPTFSVYEARRHAWVATASHEMEHWD